jgi:sugar-phosphatase
VIEDAPAGLAAARAAGIRSVGVIGTHPDTALGDATYVIAALSGLQLISGDRSDPLTVKLTPA